MQICRLSFHVVLKFQPFIGLLECIFKYFFSQRGNIYFLTINMVKNI